MRKVYLWTTVWSLDTCVRESGKPNAFRWGGANDPQNRAGYLELTVQKAWDYYLDSRQTRSPTIEPDAICAFLFVAPEYYFARSSGMHAISELEKRQLVGRLAAFTSDYPRLILVPGTIAWRKPIHRPQSQMRKRDPITESAPVRSRHKRAWTGSRIGSRGARKRGST